MLSKTVGQVRIIGGRWRGRKLTVLSQNELRPTGDRMRETLFNWLTPMVRDACVLDCFAGSGALGLEALSRAARYVRLLERHHLVAQQLTKTLHQLGSPAATILNVDSRLYLAQPADRLFNVVFLDPPFYQAIIGPLIAQLEHYHWLADQAWIYIESEAALHAPSVPVNWCLYREQSTRQVASRLYSRALPLQYITTT